MEYLSTMEYLLSITDCTQLKFGKSRSVVNPTILILFVISVLFCIVRYLNYRGLPPGPRGLPFIGVVFSILNKNPLNKYCELATKFGKVFYLKLGIRNLVILADPKIIKEAFTKEEFSGKPCNEFYKLLGGYGIINTEGHIWREQRRFLHACLRYFGMTEHNARNSERLESRIMREVYSIVRHIKGHRGHSMDLNHGFTISISNVICSLLMSVRFTFNDERFKQLMGKIEEGFGLFGNIVLINYFPFLRFFPYFLREFKKIDENKRQTHQFFQHVIDDHRRDYNTSKTEDVLDTYLHVINFAEEKGFSENLFQGKEHNSHIRQIIVDLFTAGVETTKTTLHWTLIYMLHHPERAKEIQTELDSVVGRKRMPSFDDLPYLPQTEATILEVLRKSSVVPLGNSHATTKEVQFRGYRIPKNTEIVPLLYLINNDPELWESPEKFLPERFINEAGRVTRPDHFIPFGVGRRNCLGERLARMEIYLFFASILHLFDLSLPEGDELPNLEGQFGITLTPAPYKIKLVERPFDGNIDSADEL